MGALAQRENHGRVVVVGRGDLTESFTLIRKNAKGGFAESGGKKGGVKLKSSEKQGVRRGGQK